MLFEAQLRSVEIPTSQKLYIINNGIDKSMNMLDLICNTNTNTIHGGVKCLV